CLFSSSRQCSSSLLFCAALFSCSFFFRSSPYHPDLHSFPTRRSSDLSVWSLTTAPASSSARPRSSATTACSTRASPWAAPARTRSEEHTSELQSRFDLVCRLLLEKKKYK